MKLALAQAAERCGVHPDTLRDWGKQTPPVGPRFSRTQGGHRRYDEDDIREWQLAMERLQDRVNQAAEDQVLASAGIVRQRVNTSVTA